MKSMISKEDVINAYQYILGRAPENPEVVSSHLVAETISELRTRFLQSPEFLNSIANTELNIDDYLPSQALPRIHVDCEATSGELAVVLDRIQREWEEFGEKEPHWSVLTHDIYKQNVLNDNKKEFFESGRFVTQIIETFFSRADLEIPRSGKCLELGCGVGRITIHLASVFESVIGVDISKFHLEVCREELIRENVNNVSLICLEQPQSLIDLPSFDFFCSFIVLQHNPPPAITFLLDTILGKLTRGGVAIFQVPTYRRGYQFSMRDYLGKPKPLHMEMHVLPQTQVFRILARHGCRVVEVREDGWAEGRTADSISNTFYVIKE